MSSPGGKKAQHRAINNSSSTSSSVLSLKEKERASASGGNAPQEGAIINNDKQSGQKDTHRKNRRWARRILLLVALALFAAAAVFALLEEPSSLEKQLLTPQQQRRLRLLVRPLYYEAAGTVKAWAVTYVSPYFDGKTLWTQILGTLTGNNKRGPSGRSGTPRRTLHPFLEKFGCDEGARLLVDSDAEAKLVRATLRDLLAASSTDALFEQLQSSTSELLRELPLYLASEEQRRVVEEEENSNSFIASTPSTPQEEGSANTATRTILRRLNKGGVGVRNDDYCDCPTDGSDETQTDACAMMVPRYRGSGATGHPDRLLSSSSVKLAWCLGEPDQEAPPQQRPPEVYGLGFPSPIGAVPRGDESSVCCSWATNEKNDGDGPTSNTPTCETLIEAARQIATHRREELAVGYEMCVARGEYVEDAVLPSFRAETEAIRQTADEMHKNFQEQVQLHQLYEKERKAITEEEEALEAEAVFGKKKKKKEGAEEDAAAAEDVPVQKKKKINYLSKKQRAKLKPMQELQSDMQRLERIRLQAHQMSSAVQSFVIAPQYMMLIQHHLVDSTKHADADPTSNEWKWYNITQSEKLFLPSIVAGLSRSELADNVTLRSLTPTVACFSLILHEKEFRGGAADADAFDVEFRYCPFSRVDQSRARRQRFAHWNSVKKSGEEQVLLQPSTLMEEQTLEAEIYKITTLGRMIDVAPTPTGTHRDNHFLFPVVNPATERFNLGRTRFETYIGHWEDVEKNHSSSFPRVVGPSFPSTGPTLAHQYEHGDSCWQGPQRHVYVFYRCGPRDQLLAVYENGKCSYEAIFQSPSACCRRTSADANAPKKGERGRWALSADALLLKEELSAALNYWEGALTKHNGKR